MLYTILYYYIYPKVFTLTFILPFLRSLSSPSSSYFQFSFFVLPSSYAYYYYSYSYLSTRFIKFTAPYHYRPLPLPPIISNISSSYISCIYDILVLLYYTSFFWLFDCLIVFGLSLVDPGLWFGLSLGSGSGLEVLFYLFIRFVGVV